MAYTFLTLEGLEICSVVDTQVEISDSRRESRILETSSNKS